MDASTPTHPTRRRPRRARAVASLVAAAATLAGLVTLGPGAPAGAAIPTSAYLVSRDAGGVARDGLYAALSGDGRFVAFHSESNQLVGGDTNGVADVFVKDRWSGAVERVSVSTAEAQGNGTSTAPSISDNGRYVAFLTVATNLVPGDSGSFSDVVVRDRLTGTTTRVSRGHDGAQLSANAFGARISGNGRFVVWHTTAAGVVPDDTNNRSDVFLFDRQLGTNERVSISTLEAQSGEDSANGSVSDDGRFVAFRSEEELAGGDVDDSDVFVRDRAAGTTILVTVPVSGTLDGDAGDTRISGNGRYVAYTSAASTLVANDSNGVTDVFRRDLQTNVTSRPSLHDNDSQLGTNTTLNDISDDGNQVLFTTTSPAVSGIDAGGDSDAFVRTVSSASTRRISTSAAFPDPAAVSPGSSLSDNGLATGFYSSAALVDDHGGAGNRSYVTESLATSELLGTDAFVGQQVRDFLGRNPLPGELASYRAQITRGALHPAQLIGDLALTPAFATDRSAVVRLYWAFFLRRPDAAGLDHWIARRQAGDSLPKIAQAFAGSKEFKDRYGALGDQQFVSLVYQNVFERQPDASGLAFWTNELATGKRSRGTVLVGFSESAEGKRLLAPQSHATLISLGMLRTPPSKALWDSVLAAYDKGETHIEWVAQTVLLSAEYYARLD